MVTARQIRERTPKEGIDLLARALRAALAVLEGEADEKPPIRIDASTPVSVDEAAALRGCSPQAIRNMRDRGALEAIDSPHLRQVRFRLDAIAQLASMSLDEAAAKLAEIRGAR